MADSLSLHPDCPDLRKLGPTGPEAALRALAARVEYDKSERGRLWSRGFTRRRFVKGAGMVGVASVAAQTVTARAAFSAQPADATNTCVFIFQRGGADGLSMMCQPNDPVLRERRPDIGLGGSAIPLDREFGMHPAFEPLKQYWDSKQMTMVPAVSTPDLSRSHFQAQDCLERGGSAVASASSGWLDRVLAELGPGTTFRAIGYGSTLQRALVGGQGALALQQIGQFKIEGYDGVKEQTRAALAALYTGFDDPLVGQAGRTLAALADAERIAGAEYESSAEYPDGGLGDALADLARLIKDPAIGVRVACIDVGGYDTHTGMGGPDGGDMRNNLSGLAEALAAFATDLGDALNRTTVCTMTEFGRRIEQNGSGGTDHGHGGCAMLLGGGVNGGTVHGNWQGLGDEVLDNGDVPGSNDYRNLLGDLVGNRLGLSAAALANVFPGWTVEPIGVARA